MNLVERLIELDRKVPKRILVVGDVMTDVYVHGRLEECQDGCQKFIEESRVQVPGGAANAARSLKNWLARRYCSLQVTIGPPVKTRMMVGNKCVFRYDDDRIGTDLNIARESVRHCFNDHWPEAVLISDYDKGLLTPEFLREVIGACQAQGIPCVADAKRSPELYRGAVIKGNAAWGHRFNTCNHVITNGMYPPQIDGDSIDYNTPYTIKCINHVGAGDCFSAHLTLALAHGFSLKEAAAVAHSAGRVYVQYPHNRPPTPDEILADYNLSTG